MIDGGLATEFRKHMRHIHWQRIETGGTGLGIPDVNGCVGGTEFWIEMKQTQAWAVAVRTEQISWAERRIRAGGRVFLATRRRCSAGPRRVAADELWLHWGGDTRGVASQGLRDGPPPVLRLEGGPSQWLWPLVEEALLISR